MKTTCPKCGSENYGQASAEPATMNGWYGDEYVSWGRVGGVHCCRVVRLRCHDCGHEAPNPDFHGFDN